MEAHQLIAELCGFINRWPATTNRDTWKRFRLAVTQEELDMIIDYYRKDNADEKVYEIVLALRGVPLVVEPHPTQPLHTLVMK